MKRRSTPVNKSSVYCSAASKDAFVRPQALEGSSHSVLTSGWWEASLLGSGVPQLRFTGYYFGGSVWLGASEAGGNDQIIAYDKQAAAGPA